MKLLQKDHIKELMVLVGITILIMMGVSFFLNKMQYKEYQNALNQTTKAIIEISIEENPEIKDKLMERIKQIEVIDTKEAEKLLAQYGYEERDIAIFSSIHQSFEKNALVNGIMVGVLGSLFFIIFAIFLIRRDKKIEEITEYLKKVQKRDYSLKIEENTEGELSILRNEIYKITVMLKEEAEELSKEKKSLANSLSDISHQLKTPLTSISVMVDVLKQNTNMPLEEREEFLREITRQLNWINWLVISLLKLSKLDAGTADLKKEKVECKKLVNTVVKNLSIPIEIENQKVEIVGEEKACLVGDFNWTQEAVLNVVKNCLEHTPEGGTVKIQYLENPIYTEIRIQDNGKGIPKEDLPNIFKRFYKGKNASKDSVGIGLALAESIIQKQGGTISVQSEVGKGSKFSIKLYKGVI